MTRAALALAVLLAAGAATASELEIRQSEHVLTNGLPSWNETSVLAEWSNDPRAGLGFSASALDRFGLHDTGVRMAGHAPLGPFDFALEASGSTTHNVIPEWSAGGRVGYVFGNGLVASTGFRWSRYESTTVSNGVGIATAGLEYYFDAYRVAATTYFSVLNAQWSTSYALAADMYYTRGRIGLVLAAGTELESIGGGTILSTDVLSAALIGRTPITTGWALTYGAEVIRQGDLYTRWGGRLGVVCEF